jgi:hypothetical protein
MGFCCGIMIRQFQQRRQELKSPNENTQEAPFKTQPTLNSICKLDGIIITKQTIFFKFFIVRRNLQNSFTADAENVHHLLHHF